MIEVTITGLSHEGRGIAHHHQGKTIFVDGALPTEIVRCQLIKRHQSFDEAQIIDIINPSIDRIQPRCPHFSYCGGCQLQHIHADNQIDIKQQWLLEQLQHFGHVQPEVLLEPLRGPVWGYRHKARLSVKYVEKKQALLVGFHEKNGRYVADIRQCDVLHPRVGLLIEPLKKLIEVLSVVRQLAQIEVAITDKTTALLFRHLAPLTNQDREQLISFGQTHDVHIYLHPNKPEKIYRLYPSEDDELLYYMWGNISFAFFPTDFTQINPTINTQMISLALELFSLNSTDHVLDLFCGLGNFTLPIAKYAKHVTGVEGNNEMVKRAQINALRNQFTNTQFYMSNLVSPDIQAPWMQQTYNKILLDPPRTGALEIIRQFPRLRPERIVYVSCNPATLARDASELVHQQGYRLLKAGIMDMFPQTKHVESIALFVR